MSALLAWWKHFIHDVLDWHTPDNKVWWFDGATTHSKCKVCGVNIGLDSQGNWFAFERYRR